MLCSSSKLELDGDIVGTTPMLIPSLSSRANVKISETIDIMKNIVNGPMLVSAYDFCYFNKEKLKEDQEFPKLNFSELIILDSGGYEVLQDSDIFENGYYKPSPFEWNETLYEENLKKWCTNPSDPQYVPTIFVSYDHPLERLSIKLQIERARKSFQEKEHILKEILIKSEFESDYLNVSNFIDNIEFVNNFDIIGFTEKELGNSIFERMKAIASIKLEMEAQKIKKPIHIFGSLDPVTTPLYYMSGAEIFDGLSWLKYIFDSGNGFYINSHGPKMFGIQETTENLEINAYVNNYRYIKKMENELKNVYSTKRIDAITENSDWFQNKYDELNDALGGVL